jgi:phage-related protein
MSKFLDTQFSITGIKDFDIGSSYSKYDLVDFEYFTGNFKDPLNLSGLYAWYNLDDLNNLEFDSSGRVYTWYNSAVGHEIGQDLLNLNISPDTRPFYDKYKNCITFESSIDSLPYKVNFLSTTGDGFIGFLTGDRCWFIVYEFESLRQGNYGSTIKPNIATIIDTDLYSDTRYPTNCATSGYLSVSGNNEIYSWNNNVPSSSQQFIINPTGESENSPSTANSAFSAANVIKNKNIVSIIKNNDTNNLRLRNNGFELLSFTTEHFNSGCSGLRLGSSYNAHADSSLNAQYNYDASNISYYEVLGFAKVPSDNDILAIEKYLFEKHFTNDDGLYIAKSNFTASDYRYSPINISGSEYLTKNIDSVLNKTYGCSANFSTKAARMDYGDNYYTNVIPNINNLNSNFSLQYDGLTDAQAKCLIGFFQNSFEYTPKTIVDSYENVTIDLFFPYKNNSKIYFSDLQYNSIEANINNISIKCISAYDSTLDYRGYQVTGKDVTSFFDENKAYFKNDVVYNLSSVESDKGYYWYTGLDNTVPTHDQRPTGNNSLFTKSFYFQPDLDFEIPISPKLVKTEFESSAASFENYGINKTNLELNYNLSSRSDKEAQAILKFLDVNAGFKIFEMTLPSPYNKKINVYAPEWSHVYKFKNNHDISIKFLEFKGLTDSDIFFNTIIQL